MSPSTGMILNNEMDDFSYPGQVNLWGVEPSPNNYPIPGKRPLSSMAPSVIVDEDGSATMVAGAAGGTMITTTIAYVRHWYNTWYSVYVLYTVVEKFYKLYFISLSLLK